MPIEFSVLSFVSPGGVSIPIGILVFDPDTQRLRARLRRNWEQIADADDAEVLAALSEDLVKKGREWGGSKLIDYLEDTLSGTLRITNRQPIESLDLDVTVQVLYERYVKAGP